MKEYVGNLYQIGGTRHYSLTDGSCNGTRCIDVKTGSGFEYTVVCDRGLDISLASFEGMNLVYLTAGMESNPAFYNSSESEWLRTFSAGLLTTCGPTHLSNPCEDAGERLGLHGRWSSLSAKQVCDLSDYEEGKIEIRGSLHEAVPFGYKLNIKRSIQSEFGKSVVIIEDEIENESGRPAPLNVLYHVNFGYPFLNENATIHVPNSKCRGYEEYSQERIHEQCIVKPPGESPQEKNFLHTFEEQEGVVTAWIHNASIRNGIAVYLRFDSKQLPYMTQWVMEDVKDYVVALEPANVPCEPRNVLRNMGIFPTLAPGEKRRFRLEIGVINGNEAIEKQLGK
jgi:galactose mutarotase-like enzyme